jgi:starch phosphorylase
MCNQLKKMICSNSYGTFFGITQDTLDRCWNNLTSEDGNSCIYITMEIGAEPDVYNPVKQYLETLGPLECEDEEITTFLHRFLKGPGKIPTYGGGLGILAGDTLKGFADNKIPVAAISLFYQQGYFTQLVDPQLGQVDWKTLWQPEKTPGLYLLRQPANPDIPLQIEVPFFDENNKTVMAYANIWLKLEINNDRDFAVPEFLLDYNTAKSPSWIADAANKLYDSSSERTKAIQRRMLGAGVLPVRDLFGLTSRVYHLNEQHGVVVILHLIAEQLMQVHGRDYGEKASDEDIIAAAEQVSQQVVYTIHTPVKAGHDLFSRTLYGGLTHIFCRRVLDLLARDQERPEMYNFTNLAMQVNRATNSVSRLHKSVTQKQFPQFAEKITAITNGVHHLTWISQARKELLDSFPELNGWQQNPGILKRTGSISADNSFKRCFQTAWQKDTEILVNYVNNMLVEHRKQARETWIDPPNMLSYIDEEENPIKPSTFTIGFARRFSTYKRADLIFDDIDKLIEPIINNQWPVNFLFAGKAHPADEPGKILIKHILETQEILYQKSRGLAKLVFIPGYDMKLAKMMVSGVHAWLNSPKRPLEASGTSGMKAAMNGVPNISIMDGWWVEGYHDGETGWKFGSETEIDQQSLSEEQEALQYSEDSASFYELFPKILDCFYNDPDGYLQKGMMNFVLNVPAFNTYRMIAEYIERYQISLPDSINDSLAEFRSLYQSD